MCRPRLTAFCSTIIGATLGGVLARPAISLPTWFQGTIFDTYPYLLPNLVCAAVVVFGLTVGILFLEETHEDRKYDPDRGLEAGRWLIAKMWRRDAEPPLNDKDGSLDEMRSMLEGHSAREYSSTNSSQALCSSRTSLSEPRSLDELEPMLDGRNARACRSTASSPTLCSARSSFSDSEPPPYSLEKDLAPSPRVRDAFTKQVCLNIACYGILAL